MKDRCYFNNININNVYIKGLDFHNICYLIDKIANAVEDNYVGGLMYILNSGVNLNNPYFQKIYDKYPPLLDCNYQSKLLNLNDWRTRFNKCEQKLDAEFNKYSNYIIQNFIQANIYISDDRKDVLINEFITLINQYRKLLSIKMLLAFQNSEPQLRWDGFIHGDQGNNSEIINEVKKMYAYPTYPRIINKFIM